MFFKKKKKKYTIKPNFEGPSSDFNLMKIALLGRMTNDDDLKRHFVAGVICHWVFDEEAQEFLPAKKGVKWLAERIKAGEGDALSTEIDKAIRLAMAERELSELFKSE